METRVCSLALVLVIIAMIPAVTADEANQSDNAWYWYNQAVDLANAGNFSGALAANEKALAINQEFPLAWANQAGILVQLGRYDDAVHAADNVLNFNSTEQPMVNAYAAAYYSKGDALLGLGNVSGAQDCYARAHELDPTLPVPDLSADEVILPKATTTRSPLPPVIIPAAFLVLFAYARYRRRT
jgi:tetratricopeptide (TPR) repeat protein